MDMTDKKNRLCGAVCNLTFNSLPAKINTPEDVYIIIIHWINTSQVVPKRFIIIIIIYFLFYNR